MDKIRAWHMQVLSSLGGWPEGPWYRVDYRGQPHGSLVQIKLIGSVLHVCKLDAAAMQLGSFFQILLDRLPVSAMLAMITWHVIHLD